MIITKAATFIEKGPLHKPILMGNKMINALSLESYEKFIMDAKKNSSSKDYEFLLPFDYQCGLKEEERFLFDGIFGLAQELIRIADRNNLRVTLRPIIVKEDCRDIRNGFEVLQYQMKQLGLPLKISKELHKEILSAPKIFRDYQEIKITDKLAVKICEMKDREYQLDEDWPSSCPYGLSREINVPAKEIIKIWNGDIKKGVTEGKRPNQKKKEALGKMKNILQNYMDAFNKDPSFIYTIECDDLKREFMNCIKWQQINELEKEMEKELLRKSCY